jgi:tetratricopeptide (TPR) repeat protein
MVANIADVAARIALALAATVIAAGMAVQLHAHDLVAGSVTELKRELGGKPDPAQNKKALDDALEASRIQPGSGALFIALGLEQRAGHAAQAERLALRATHREPDNFATWLTLGIVRQGRGDTAGANTAFAQAQRLNPLYRTPRP